MSRDFRCRCSPADSDPAAGPSVIARVRRTLVERGLVRGVKRVLCACSGGPDSAALMGALATLAPELGLELEVASVDHGLRPGAAEDVAIAARQAASLGLGFHALRVEVSPGGSLQAKARAARYGALKRLAAERGLERIAVGHTQDDQAETVLLRMLRGSGLRGLSAIDPHRADGVIRPLIDCPRGEVLGWAEASFAELARDPSNADDRFGRVRLRTHVMPVLLRENPRLVEHLAALSDEAREERAPIRTAAEALLREADSGGDSLRLSVLAERPGRVRRAALSVWLQARGVEPLSRAHLVELDRAVLSQRGHVWLPKRAVMRVEEHSGSTQFRLVLPQTGRPPTTA
jgi:tRNA(Ile)-lysidine synthase